METIKIEPIYNADCLEKIEVKNPSVEHHISYKPELTGWLNKRKAGFYTESDYFLGNEQDLLNGAYYNTKLLVKDNVVYYRPYVKLTFIGGSTKVEKFDTIEQCNEYATEISEKYIKNKI